MALIDSHETIPLANKPETILGSGISVQLLAIVSVILRVYARHRQGRKFGWDDFFVVLSCTSTLAGTIFVCLQPSAGLGKHMKTLNEEQIQRYLFYTYGSICTYASSTSLIKVSLLFQYLRLARTNYKWFRRTCFTLLVVVSAWGMTYFFTTVFSCSPVEGYWKPRMHGARCVLIGSRDPETRINTYISQSASNMALDLIIFILPIYLVNTLQLTRRNRLGLIGVFTLGALVVVISILRLASITHHRLGIMPPFIDTTWYAPLTVIWTCLEVNVAVICASIPIFWPVIKQLGFGKILVVREVVVKTELRSSRTGDERSEDEQELTMATGWVSSAAVGGPKATAMHCAV